MDLVLEGVRAAADPTRLRILGLLESGELTVSELCVDSRQKSAARV